MDVLGSAGQVELNLSLTQLDEGRQVRALASGLRVQSAIDDPSGNSIAANLQTKVLGLQQGVQNVQTAGNLLTVADGALSTVQTILSRVRSLIVESRSSVNSSSQLQEIQSEIDTLLQEVNHIASKASFNGVNLFDGHLSPYTPFPLQATITQVNPEPDPNGQIPSSNVVNADGLGNPGPLIQQNGIGPATSVPCLLEFRVLSYDASTNSDVVQLTAYSLSGSGAFGQAPLMQDTAEIPVNAGPTSGVATPTPSGGGVLLQNYTIANLTPQDVGTAQAFLVTNPGFGAPPPPSGQALQVNAGGGEGDVVSIGLPEVNVQSLGLSEINVVPSDVINFNNQLTGNTGNDNTYAVDYAESTVDNAIQAVSTIRGQVGSQMVALQEGAGDASEQIVAQTASQSSIADANIGQSAAQLTKDQVLSKIGLSVLAQMQNSAQLVEQLVSGSAFSARGH